MSPDFDDACRIPARPKRVDAQNTKVAFVADDLLSQGEEDVDSMGYAPTRAAGMVFQSFEVHVFLGRGLEQLLPQTLDLLTARKVQEMTLADGSLRRDFAVGDTEPIIIVSSVSKWLMDRADWNHKLMNRDPDGVRLQTVGDARAFEQWFNERPDRNSAPFCVNNQGVCHKQSYVGDDPSGLIRILELLDQTGTLNTNVNLFLGSARHDFGNPVPRRAVDRSHDSGTYHHQVKALPRRIAHPEQFGTYRWMNAL